MHRTLKWGNSCTKTFVCVGVLDRGQGLGGMGLEMDCYIPHMRVFFGYARNMLIYFWVRML